MYKWKDEYSVKISKIDKQHKKLFETFSILSLNMTKSSTKRELDKAINQCKKAVLDHFRDEERILKQCKYKDFEEHKEEHNKFAKKIKSKLKEFKNSEHTDEDIIYIYGFLNDWLVDHIMDSDNRYIDDVKDFHDC